MNNMVPMGQRLGKFNGKPKHRFKKTKLSVKPMDSFLMSVNKEAGIILKRPVFEEILDKVKVPCHTHAFTLQGEVRDETAGILKAICTEDLYQINKGAHEGAYENSGNFFTALFTYKFDTTSNLMAVTYYYFSLDYTRLITGYAKSFNKEHA